MEVNDIITTDVVRVLEMEVAKLENDNSCSLFMIDKKTLKKLCKMISRDEALKKKVRDRYRNNNEVSSKKFRHTDNSYKMVPFTLPTFTK